MVRGLEKFKEFFAELDDHYVVIGGTACDIILEEEGFTPRVTKDIDIILIIEALDREFAELFWAFIREGGYARREKGDAGRQYYRFTKPSQEDFPQQIELFARRPEVIAIDEAAHLTPIPLDDDLSSLSAILLDDAYYHYMIDHSDLRQGVRCANVEALISLKAKAFLEISDRIAHGGIEDSKHIRKHKEDIFRLALTLRSTDNHVLPDSLKADLQMFMQRISDDLPDKEFFKRMGLSGIDPRVVYDAIVGVFQLDIRL
jgi:hypothetical protein